MKILNKTKLFAAARRLTAGAVAICAIMLCACSGKNADMAKNPEIYKTQVTTQNGISAELTYNEADFTGKSTDFCESLADASIMLSQCCYLGETALETCFEEINFTDVVTMNFGTKPADSVAYALASRKMSDGFTMIAVAVRGTSGDEWLSNFNIADSAYENSDTALLDEGWHEGFYMAYQDMQTALNDYIGKHVTDAKKTRFWITGHSRGAAVANIAASGLVRDGSYGSGNIFCYTFAAPNVKILTDAEKTNADYNCIFNIVRDEDFVARIPFAKWGFGKFGRTYAFPSKGSDGYNAIVDKASARLVELTGKEYSGMENGRDEVDKLVSDATTAISGVEAYYSGDKSPADFFKMAAQMLSGDANVNLLEMLTIAGQSGLGDVSADFMEISGAIGEAHMPSTYAAWLDAGTFSDLVPFTD